MICLKTESRESISSGLGISCHQVVLQSGSISALARPIPFRPEFVLRDCHRKNSAVVGLSFVNPSGNCCEVIFAATRLKGSALNASILSKIEYYGINTSINEGSRRFKFEYGGEMTRELDRYFVRKTLESLVPGIRISERYIPKEEARRLYVFKKNDYQTGIHNGRDSVEIWLDAEDGKSVVFTLQRDEIPISSKEKRVLSFVPDVLEHILPRGGVPELQQLQRISARMVVGTTIVSKFLHNKKGEGFWGPSYILMILQGVLARNYEGVGATSGFIITPKLSELDSDKLKSIYDIHLFDGAVQVDEDFFDDPVSYRYVDGRNAFYIVDRQSYVRGIVRIKQPLRWSLGNRVYGEHLMPLLNHLHGKTWAAIVGNKRDIQIFTRAGPEIRWSQSKWQFLHLENVYKYIASHVGSEEVALNFWQIAFSLSIMRIGALILIPGSDRRPEYASKIDLSELQDKIFRTMKGLHIRSFVDGVGMFGVFGSDGLVVVDKSGHIEEAGRIVAIEKQDQVMAGGGRTQAAFTCSKYGLVLKVSEDGPISLVQNEKVIFKTIG